MGSPGRPNHCLPPQVHPGSFKNPPKTLPKPSQKPPSKLNALKNRYFQCFFDLLTAPGLPKSSQNRKNSKKTLKNRRSKYNISFNQFVSRFFVVLASENDAKIELFWYIFE